MSHRLQYGVQYGLIQVADLYCRRWLIEEAFLVAKRLLGLAYLWTGSITGIKLKFGLLG